MASAAGPRVPAARHLKTFFCIVSMQGHDKRPLPCGTNGRDLCMSRHEAQHAANELHVNPPGFHFRSSSAIEMYDGILGRSYRPPSGWSSIRGRGCRGIGAEVPRPILCSTTSRRVPICRPRRLLDSKTYRGAVCGILSKMLQVYAPNIMFERCTHCTIRCDVQ